MTSVFDAALRAPATDFRVTMYCPFCGCQLGTVGSFCSACGKMVEFLPGASSVNEASQLAPATALQSTSGTQSHTLENFLKFRNEKKQEKEKFSAGKKKRHDKKKSVQISVGIMSRGVQGLKPQRGKALPLMVDPCCSAQQLLPEAVKKLKDFNQDLSDGQYVLLYPDGREVRNIPGTDEPFTLSCYKEAIGKPYTRITLYICASEEFNTDNVGQEDEDSSDSEVIVNQRCPSDEFTSSDTLPLENPQDSSTPVMQRTPHNNDKARTLDKSTDVQQKCYREYTDLYAPIVIDSSSCEEDEIEQATAKGTDEYSVADVISNLSANIVKSSCSRFNINRANVWDGALRGFKRSSFDPTVDMLVKFSDDAGQTEEAVDTGGPKREFLSLLMECLKRRRIFDGPENCKYLTFDSAAARDDEYYQVGKMIAVSVVHGGPGPRFLSRDLFHYIAGEARFEASIEDIIDEDIKAPLFQISGAESLNDLRALVERHSTMLQTAGCFQYPKSMDDKDRIVKDYLQWYIIYRNHFSVQRFSEGLATLDFAHALEQHPSKFADVMCYSEEKLTGPGLESLFHVQLSAVGSNRHQEETRILGYWRDYLLDSEEQDCGVSLQDILMFATGLQSLPPAGIQPHPHVQFHSSPFPMANTCANQIILPASASYEEFKEKMDFGIHNSPGFGRA